MVIVNMEERAIAVFDKDKTKAELLRGPWAPLLQRLKSGETVGGFKFEYATQFFTVISDGSEVAKAKLA